MDRGCSRVLGKTYVDHLQTLKGDFTMKKIMVLMLSVVMVFSLAACGGQDGGSASTPQPTNEGSGTENNQNPSGLNEEESKESSDETLMEESGDSSTGASVGDVEITEGKTLVVYYSATGYTERVAE